MLPFWARVDLAAMAIKRYPASSKALALQEPHHQLVQCHKQNIGWGGVPSAEMQSVYSTVPAEWAEGHLCYMKFKQPCPVFELRLLCLFLMLKSVTP